MAQVLEQASDDRQQLGFFGAAMPRRSGGRTTARGRVAEEAPLCAGCRAREARYGFRQHDDDPTTERPRTLCFDCFRVELAHREAVAARLARGWNASQVPLPLEDTLNQLSLRRRRAQIAARKALGL